ASRSPPGGPPTPGTDRRGRWAGRRCARPTPAAARARRGPGPRPATGRGRGGSRSRSVAPGVPRVRRRRALAAEPATPPLDPDAAGLGRPVDLPPQRVEDEVPCPDVPHLAPTEAGLEVGDPAGREAPQVVARRPLLARRPDRLPLEEVVGPRVAAGPGHSAIRLDDARSAADEEQRRDRLAVLRLGEQQPGEAVRRERVPDVAVGLLGPDQEPGPVGGLAVDRVELAEAVTVGVDDRHARAAGLVHVLPPLLSEVAPERVLVGAEVDDPARVRLDRRGRAE